MRVWKRTPRGPFTFEAFGVPVELELSDAKLERQIADILPPGWRRCDASEEAVGFGLRELEEDSYEVTIGDEVWLEHATLDVALGMLDAQMRLYIAANAPDWVFVHAGVVAHGGRALVIPGQSFSGKTTLVAALVEAGASYCSDEYAVLDRDGRVHPYARRLSIRSEDGGTQELHASQLGGNEIQDSVELAAVVVTRYRPGATWRPTRRSSGAGLVALLANTVPAQERPQECMSVLSRAVAGAVVLEGDRGEAGPVAAALLETLAAPAPR